MCIEVDTTCDGLWFRCRGSREDLVGCGAISAELLDGRGNYRLASSTLR